MEPKKDGTTYSMEELLEVRENGYPGEYDPEPLDDDMEE